MASPLDMQKIIPLITGGGSGIGLGLVKQFLKRGSPKLLITGRREEVLQSAADEFPEQIFYRVSDAGAVQDREDLLTWVQTEHPDCNALVNNAGVQRQYPLHKDDAAWHERAHEIEINLHGPKETTLLANVSSGLAFVPYPNAPVYCATKAALHSYTMSLRYALSETNVRVVEIIPPAVKSNLGGAHDFGEDLDEYVEATMKRVQAGEIEVGYKFSETARMADRAQLDGMMDYLATAMQVPKYAVE